ncbi:hypothetical protein Pan44_13790 [Caulifigura coniformis]|uniref:Uncharacterized protein n=1 Tax=Caulifigura coniformis TaxID=2527983 RepID=A0A517SB72_9PLAN|nr:hypothetical protein [Caulifigura coniformis]QDT53362.1 hypothetical protein Pan44_13790 [Caulifigura coniformis]
MRKYVARMLVMAAIAGVLSPASGFAQGKSLSPPGASRALAHRVAKGPSKPSPSNRGGRGFDQRMLHAMRNFDRHVSCDPPLRPRSP